MKEIMINGTPAPIHFGTGSIRDFTQEGGRNFEDVISGNIGGSLDALFELICTGLNYGAERRNIERRYTVREVEFMVDDDPDILREALGVFVESVQVLQSKLADIAQIDKPGNASRPKTASPRAKTIRKASR